MTEKGSIHQHLIGDCLLCGGEGDLLLSRRGHRGDAPRRFLAARDLCRNCEIGDFLRGAITQLE